MSSANVRCTRGAFAVAVRKRQRMRPRPGTGQARWMNVDARATAAGHGACTRALGQPVRIFACACGERSRQEFPKGPGSIAKGRLCDRGMLRTERLRGHRSFEAGRAGKARSVVHRQLAKSSAGEHVSIGFDGDHCNFAGFYCHKSIKSGLAALSKAGGHWYIPAATSRPLRPRVAFSGSLWTEAARLSVDPAISAFRKVAKVYRGVEQPGSSSGS